MSLIDQLLSMLRRFFPASMQRKILPHDENSVALRIPVQTGHTFHGKLDSHSRANWTLIPRQIGQ